MACSACLPNPLYDTLRDRDARFRDLFDGHPVPMWVHDAESLKFLAVNDAARAQYDFSEAEFYSMSIRDIYAPEDVGRLESYLARFERASHAAGAHGAAGVWKHVRSDGTVINADLSYHMIAFRNRKACFVLANDVTDYMKVEAEVHRSNQMLESIIDNIPQPNSSGGITRSRFLGCNIAFARDAGLAYTEQVIGKRDDDLPWGRYAQAMREQDQEVIATGIPKMQIEEVLIDHQGAEHNVLSSKLPLMSGEGRIIGLLGTFTDITEQKRSELALRLQSRALEASVNAIMITAPTSEGNIIEYVNPAFSSALPGYESQRGAGVRLPIPAARRPRPGRVGADTRGAEGRSRSQRGAAQLPQGRRAVLEPTVHCAGSRCRWPHHASHQRDQRRDRDDPTLHRLEITRPITMR